MLNYSTVKGRVNRANRVNVRNFRIHDVARNEEADTGQQDICPLQPIARRAMFYNFDRIRRLFHVLPSHVYRFSVTDFRYRSFVSNLTGSFVPAGMSVMPSGTISRPS